jgi:hypothetical protein
VDDGPFALPCATAHFDADGLHHAFARACSVAGRFVDVPAVETRRAVVAMLGAHCFSSPHPAGLPGNLKFAVDTRKTVRLVSALMLK